jgi:hypothetical protein
LEEYFKELLSTEKKDESEDEEKEREMNGNDQEET